MNNKQKILIALVILSAFYILFSICRYWYADTLYAKGKGLNQGGNPIAAQKILVKAAGIAPQEAGYRLELAESYTQLGLAQEAVSEIKKAISLSPYNINLRKAESTIYIRLSAADPKFLAGAISSLEEAVSMAPTDAKLFYHLGLTYVRVGEIQKALDLMQKTIEMKPNYKEARLAYAILLIDIKEIHKAKKELNYILTNIDSRDELTKKTLEEIE